MLSITARVAYPDFDLEVEQELALDRVTGLFGPSGGGKSTLLRIIAGLERHATGMISFGGETWQDDRAFIPAHRRPVGYVFQDARLFPHLSVAGNLDYAVRRSSAGSIDYDEVVAAFDLGPLLHRSVDVLSGGEKQRVAIGRTLLTQPKLLLLDEPLAALDAGRKGEILPYLEALPGRFGIPAIYVSHAVDEVARLADHVVVLDSGRIRAMGDTTKILNREDLQVTILEVRVKEHLPDLRLTHVDHHGQAITVPILESLRQGDIVRLYVRAGDVAVATQRPEGLSVRNVLEGTVSGVAEIADSAFATVSVDVNGTSLKARLTRHAITELALAQGMTVYALLKTASFDRQA